MLAYHFVGQTLRDGRPIPADGEWLFHEGPVDICESGLHASLHPFDALQYAPGATLCLVECENVIQEQKDKFVCRARKIIKRIDATDLLWTALRKYALSVIHLWDAPAVVREFLETGDESKRDAARAAAMDAAMDAAWAAAMDAAWAAARAAAMDAARAAARDAAMDAAWAAARDAVRDAVWDAAMDAAMDAAWNAKMKIFADLVDEAFK